MNDTLLKMVVKAIQNTDPKYYKVFNTVLYERLFCYEFYHQFRKQQESQNDSSVISGLSDVLLSAEPGKDTNNKLKEIRNMLEYKNRSKRGWKRHRKFPDFVFHGGLKNTEAQKQLMVIEVKRDSMIKKNEKILRSDITKLIQIIDNLQFQVGLFIAVGMSGGELKDKLKKHKGLLETCSCKENLYFIATKDIPETESNHCSLPAEDVSSETDLSKYYFSAAEFLEESLNCGSKD